MSKRLHSRVSPTHHELIRVRKKLKLVRKGKRVLERRRNRLVFLLLDLLDRFKRLHETTETEFAAAADLEPLGAMREGDVSLRELANTRATHPELIVTETKLSGLRVPFILSDHITTRLQDRGYGLIGTSALDDEITRSYEQVLESVVRIAELRGVVMLLLVEVRRLRVRVNYFTHRLLPDLEADRRYIELFLAEREQEDRVRQHWVKRRREETRR